MNAPVIWIIVPFVFALFLWLIPNERLVIWLGIGITIILALTAWLVPIETPMILGNWSVKISSTLTILGRQLIISSADQPLLIFFYGSLCFWFLCSTVSEATIKFIPFGLLIISLLISSLSVEPFLYAALLIEIAVLVSIPFIKPPNVLAGRGLVRFLTFQTIAMPFILFSGWILTGISAGPEELSLISQASIFLGLGFVFLLAIFPFNTWIPLLSEETTPTTAAFILWIFPTVGLLFGVFFLDTYSWIRESAYLPTILRTTGLLMTITGGIWAAFQKNLKRIMAYAMIMETGYSLIALSIKGIVGIEIFFGLLIPRTFSLFFWAMALSIMLKKTTPVQFSDVKGFGRIYPLSATVIILSNLSLAGVPLLAGFPIHQALWEQVGNISLVAALWFFVGTIGLLMGGIRSLAVLVAPSYEKFTINENWAQRIFLSIGILVLLFLGIFPQWMSPFLTNLPKIFSHLGR